MLRRPNWSRDRDGWPHPPRGLGQARRLLPQSRYVYPPHLNWSGCRAPTTGLLLPRQAFFHTNFTLFFSIMQFSVAIGAQKNAFLYFSHHTLYRPTIFHRIGYGYFLVVADVVEI